MIRLKTKPHDRLIYNTAQHLASNGHWAVRIVPGEVELDSDRFMARTELEKDFILIGRHPDFEAKVPDIEKSVFGIWEKRKTEYKTVTMSGRAKFDPRVRRVDRRYSIEYWDEQERSVLLAEGDSDMIESFRGEVYAGPTPQDIVFVIKDGVPVFAVMPCNI